MRSLLGRKTLKVDYSEINKDNILQVIDEIRKDHLANVDDILFLNDYKKGKQPILDRKKEIRPEIDNKIVKNHALRIVNFKTNYFLGDEIKYISKTAEENVTEQVKSLSEIARKSYKMKRDRELLNQIYTCGVGYGIVLPNEYYDKSNDDSSPIIIDNIKPEQGGVIYSSATGNRPLAGFKWTQDKESKVIISMYTKDMYYKIVDGEIVKIEPHNYGIIPIIEYTTNPDKLGAFESVIGILNAINVLESNRVDAVEQFVQYLMLFINLDIDKQSFDELKQRGAIKLVRDSGMGGKDQDVKILSQELNQTHVQTIIDSLEDSVDVLCGLPNRNGGLSTSDTGAAVQMRDGWSEAETNASTDSISYKASETESLKLTLNILRGLNVLNLTLKEIDINFSRKTKENIAQKTTVLTQLLGTDKIHPKLAFIISELFADPEIAYKMSAEYYDEAVKKEQLKLDVSSVNPEANNSTTANP